MKAARFSRFGGPEVLEIVDLPEPHPSPGQVRIAVRAAGVNASDWKKRQGLMDRDLPQTLGYEAAGIVDELGEGVTDVAIGDRVFGFSPDGAAQAVGTTQKNVETKIQHDDDAVGNSILSGAHMTLDPRINDM